MPSSTFPRSRSLRRALTPVAPAAIVLALAGCGTGQHKAGSAGATSTSLSAQGSRTASASSSTTRTVQTLVVGLTTPRTPPRSGSGWPITVTAHTAGGAPVNGRVSYAFIFGGAIVAKRPAVPGIMRGGIYHDRLKFPPAAVGYALTLEVIVQSQGSRGSTTRAVRVQR